MEEVGIIGRGQRQQIKKCWQACRAQIRKDIKLTDNVSPASPVLHNVALK